MGAYRELGGGGKYHSKDTPKRRYKGANRGRGWLCSRPSWRCAYMEIARATLDFDIIGLHILVERGILDRAIRRSD
jgi:hypothetical protein